MLDTSTSCLRSRASINGEAATSKTQIGRHVDSTFTRPLPFLLTLPLSAERPSSLISRHRDHCQTLAKSFSREVCPSTALNHTADSHTLAGPGSLQSQFPESLSLWPVYPPSPALFPSASLQNILSSIHMPRHGNEDHHLPANHFACSTHDAFHHVLGSFIPASPPCVAPFPVCNQRNWASQTEWKPYQRTALTALQHSSPEPVLLPPSSTG